LNIIPSNYSQNINMVGVLGIDGSDKTFNFKYMYIPSEKKIDGAPYIWDNIAEWKTINEFIKLDTVEIEDTNLKILPMTLDVMSELDKTFIKIIDEKMAKDRKLFKDRIENTKNLLSKTFKKATDYTWIVDQNNGNIVFDFTCEGKNYSIICCSSTVNRKVKGHYTYMKCWVVKYHTYGRYGLTVKYRSVININSSFYNLISEEIRYLKEQIKSTNYAKNREAIIKEYMTKNGWTKTEYTNFWTKDVGKHILQVQDVHLKIDSENKVSTKNMCYKLAAEMDITSF
jgi:hypothetical protein